jgi:hypothetical protein
MPSLCAWWRRCRQRWGREPERLRSWGDPVPKLFETQRHTHFSITARETDDRATDAMTVRAGREFFNTRGDEQWWGGDILPDEGEIELCNGQAWLRWRTERTQIEL